MALFWRKGRTGNIFDRTGKNGADFQIRLKTRPAPLRLLDAPSLSDEIKAIRIHDLLPGQHKVTYKLRSGVFLRIDFRDGAQL